MMTAEASSGRRTATGMIGAAIEAHCPWHGAAGAGAGRHTCRNAMVHARAAPETLGWAALPVRSRLDGSVACVMGAIRAPLARAAFARGHGPIGADFAVGRRPPGPVSS